MGILKGLPQLSPENQDKLSSDINLDELNSAVFQIASGKAPGIHGLPSHFWSVLGHDPLDSFTQVCSEKDFYLQHDVNKCFESQKSLFFSLSTCPLTLTTIPYCLLITTIKFQVILASTQRKQGKNLNRVTLSVCMYHQELIMVNFGCRSISQFPSCG